MCFFVINLETYCIVDEDDDEYECSENFYVCTADHFCCSKLCIILPENKTGYCYGEETENYRTFPPTNMFKSIGTLLLIDNVYIIFFTYKYNIDLQYKYNN